MSARPTPFTDGLCADAPEGARSVRLFVLPYAPFASAPEEATLSAYYLASQALYEYVKANCARPAFRLPLKPILAGYGIGRRGRNGLVAIEGMGTCFAVEAAWSGEEAPPRAWTEEPPLDGACKDCGLCLRACPAQALDGAGYVDTARCLRSRCCRRRSRLRCCSWCCYRCCWCRACALFFYGYIIYIAIYCNCIILHLLYPPD